MFIPELIYFWKREGCRIYGLAILNSWRIKDEERRETN